MQKQLGFILKSTASYVTVIVPFHCFHVKYKKLQIKLKKYSILNYRQEYIKGDIVFFDSKINRIITFFK